MRRFLMAEQVVERLVTIVIQMAEGTLRPEIVPMQIKFQLSVIQ
jgi:hypothetical protein